MERRVIGALSAGLVFYALSDILLWQRIFESSGHEFYRFDAQYQTGRQAVLLGMIAIGVILLWDSGGWALWFAAAFYALAFSGLEDVLYYVLDGRALPAVLPWLASNPLIIAPRPITGAGLVGSAALWLVLCGAPLLLRDRIGHRLRKFQIHLLELLHGQKSHPMAAAIDRIFGQSRTQLFIIERKHDLAIVAALIAPVMADFHARRYGLTSQTPAVID